MSRALSKSLIQLLKEVSRSFYLTMRALPERVRGQIGLAYLLARATDTIADTKLVPVAVRLKALASLRSRILKESDETLDLRNLIESNASSVSMAERRLLIRIEDIIQAIETFCFTDQQHIRQVLSTITSGQELDLQRFGYGDSAHLAALCNDLELDDYTYRVAGCVGEFWTKICRAHLFPNAPINEAWLLDNAVRFGKGLQLVNILRDLPADLRLGRCYVPADRLAAAGLRPSDLLDSSSESRFRELYTSYLRQAEAHLEAGWAYTNALPFGQVRLRLACSWPLLIGAATIQKLRASNMLDAAKRTKISRGEVRSVLVQSVIWYLWPQRWIRLFPSMRT